MISRKKLEKQLQSHFNFDVLPIDIKDEAINLASNLPLDQFTRLSDKIRYVLKSDLNQYLEKLTDVEKCSFFKCSKSLFSLIKNGYRNSDSSNIGRPTKLLTEEEKKIREWLELRASNNDFPTKREFKQKCVYHLEKQKFDGSFSKNYFDQLLNRIAPDFEIRVVQPSDFERGLLEKSDIELYFNNLRKINIETINPNLIINLDETGFGGSKSGRMKSKKFIVSKSFQGKLRYQYEETSHHISALVGITASGKVLPPCALITRGTENPDGCTCPYYNKMKVYSTPRGFMTRSVFENFFQNSIFEYVEKVRKEIGKADDPAVIIYDGLKAHISEILFAECAERNIKIVMIPPHSSHLVQPLDQGVFRSMKSKYSTVPNWPNKSKITTKLQKIYTVIQMTDNEQTILRSWEHSGIFPIIKDGIVIKVRVIESCVLQNETLIEHEPNQINEKARGKKIDKAPSGLMNEIQLERVKSGCCPLCGKKRSSNEQEETDDDS